MTLDRSTVLDGIPAELARFSALVAPLGPTELAAPTRCDGWTVAHVAGHVVGTAVDLTQGRLEGQGTPEVTERQAEERIGRTAAELAAEVTSAVPALRALLASLPEEAWEGPAPTDPRYTLGFAVEALWFDAYLHGEDVRAALGLPPERGDGLRCAVHHVAGYLTQRRWRAASLELDGLEPVHVCGGGETIQGEPLAFVLAATGRADPAILALDGSVNVYADSESEAVPG